MAVFCLAVVLIALAVAALFSLLPTGEDAVIPEVGVAPGPGVALDDAVPVAPPRHSPVSAAHLAGIEGPRVVAQAASRVADGPAKRAGIAPAQVVAVAVSDPAPTDPPRSPPAEAPPPAPPPATPIATPISAPPPPPGAPTRPLPGTGAKPPPHPAGGPGSDGSVVSGPVAVHEGDEYVYAFSFYVQPEAYRAPGEENLILRFSDEADEEHSFGLQLWDDGGGEQRGLWSSGEAMGGERFLAPVMERAWHQVSLAFRASSDGDGIYLLLLDGAPVDARAWVSLLDSESQYGLLEAGLFRDGERVLAAPDVSFGPARLGEALEPAIP